MESFRHHFPVAVLATGWRMLRKGAGLSMEEKVIGLKVNPKDNVATIFANGVTDGTMVEVHDPSGQVETIEAIGDIPYGHKIALMAISKGDIIVKYGEEIGMASRDIQKGEYVHVHNLDSMRGRGDLEKR